MLPEKTIRDVALRCHCTSVSSSAPTLLIYLIHKFPSSKLSGHKYGPKLSRMEENNSCSQPQLVWDSGLVELTYKFFGLILLLYCINIIVYLVRYYIADASIYLVFDYFTTCLIKNFNVIGTC